MTTTRQSRHRWDSTTKPTAWPQDLVRFPRKGVVGEIKPHNAEGIADGIRQLVTRTAGRRSVTPQLLTYRQVPGQPSRYEVLAADSGELKRIIAGWRPRQRVPKPTTWYQLRHPISVPAAVELIPRWQCPTQLGNLVEAQVRAKYAMQLGITLPARSASRTGADIEHELLEMAEFLRELAAELEAEVHG
ncbi:hypothetical protein HN031_20695 [Nocardioides sp. zg-1308]|uniref:Uncharacterized protein n=1 Tax=Nocardioides renjunii TaxID=3095075 RepID=A0ABU5KES1_9ACTN|nr:MULTISPECIES: hypothetical protein [unclassified Nocardioides]MDZ5663464.1 hypothetical protein [Nocardioides sp. S-58]NPD07102.1 hypothetical protein [Nocardioides sp. zg-1308]WQQ20556.1 hypothetical protein SHK17_11640 [Nocardioides sp. S-34]